MLSPMGCHRRRQAGGLYSQPMLQPMGCGRRRGGQAGTSQLLSAGRAIYNAYQDHQTAREVQQTAMPPQSLDAQSHLDQINGEVLKRADIDPPPYTPRVMNRAAASPDPPLYQTTSREMSPYSSSDDEVVRTSKLQNVASRNIPTTIPDGVYHSKKELKAAYKAVRRNEKALYKAEKAAVKVERRNREAMRKGCC